MVSHCLSITHPLNLEEEKIPPLTPLPLLQMVKIPFLGKSISKCSQLGSSTVPSANDRPILKSWQRLLILLVYLAMIACLLITIYINWTILVETLLPLPDIQQVAVDVIILWLADLPLPGGKITIQEVKLALLLYPALHEALRLWGPAGMIEEGMEYQRREVRFCLAMTIQ